MSRWFSGVRNKEEAKKRYNELAQKYHPDHNGDKAKMSEINSEYEELNFDARHSEADNNCIATVEYALRHGRIAANDANVILDAYRLRTVGIEALAAVAVLIKAIRSGEVSVQ